MPEGSDFSKRLLTAAATVVTSKGSAAKRGESNRDSIHPKYCCRRICASSNPTMVNPLPIRPARLAAIKEVVADGDSRHNASLANPARSTWTLSLSQSAHAIAVRPSAEGSFQQSAIVSVTIRFSSIRKSISPFGFGTP